MEVPCLEPGLVSWGTLSMALVYWHCWGMHGRGAQGGGRMGSSLGGYVLLLGSEGPGVPEDWAQEPEICFFNKVLLEQRPMLLLSYCVWLRRTTADWHSCGQDW